MAAITAAAVEYPILIRPQFHRYPTGAAKVTSSSEKKIVVEVVAVIVEDILNTPSGLVNYELH